MYSVGITDFVKRECVTKKYFGHGKISLFILRNLFVSQLHCLMSYSKCLKISNTLFHTFLA